MSMPRLCKNFQPSRGVVDSPLAILPTAHLLMNLSLPSVVARFSFSTKLYMASVTCSKHSTSNMVAVHGSNSSSSRLVNVPIIPWVLQNFGVRFGTMAFFFFNPQGNVTMYGIANITVRGAWYLIPYVLRYVSVCINMYEYALYGVPGMVWLRVPRYRYHV